MRREGRLTSGQGRALAELWPRFGISPDAGRLVWSEVFGRSAPVTVEIGFGNGESLAAQALAHPEQDFFGIEVHRPGVGHLLGLIERMQLTNLRLSQHDAVEVLRNQVPPASVARVQIFFPDPWPKKRHQKRRLVQAEFLGTVAECLQPGGLLHLATDWPDYAEHMLAVLAQQPDLFQPRGPQPLPKRPTERPPTRFERRGERLGHPVSDLQYLRCCSAAPVPDSSSPADPDRNSSYPAAPNGD